MAKKYFENGKTYSGREILDNRTGNFIGLVSEEGIKRMGNTTKAVINEWSTYKIHFSIKRNVLGLEDVTPEVTRIFNDEEYRKNEVERILGIGDIMKEIDEKFAKDFGKEEKKKVRKVVRTPFGPVETWDYE